MKRIFLTAAWRQLAILNFAVDPEILRSRVPVGTELDSFEGRHYLSVVGFCFLETEVLGLTIPFHSDFEEVNLRFYVRRKLPSGEWRRGVVFVRELVPRRLIAWVARKVYGEPYAAMPMRHAVRETPFQMEVSYEWQRSGVWESLRLNSVSPWEEATEGSEGAFILEHYWGYTARPGSTAEYAVEHPKWRLRRASEAKLDCDVAEVYGAPFVEFLSAPPSSAFIADGSLVRVRWGDRLPAPSDASPVS